MVGRREVAEGGLPVQDGRVEDEAADPVAHPGLGGGAQGHRGPGPPAVQHDLRRTPVDGVADGGVDVAPLGVAEVGEAVRGGRCSLVASVCGDEDGDLAAVEEGDDVQRVLAGGAEAVQGDHPGGAGRGHQPGRQGAELAGDLDVLVGEPEGADRRADVQLGGEADAGAWAEDPALDAFEAADDGVRGVRDAVEDRAG